MTVNHQTDTEVDVNAEAPAPDSSTETNTEDTNPSSGGDKNKKPDATEDDVPFHQHPRWKQREDEWNQKLLDQEKAWDKKLADALSANKPAAPQDTSVPIPEWFGGDEKQWKAYQVDQAKIIADARKQAADEAFERINSNQSAQEKAVAEANKWFEDSVAQIETTTGGQKVDRNELLKYVLENQIIDPKTQRWDYAKGYRWMTAEKLAATAKGGNRQSRKDLAGATTTDPNKGEKENSTITSSEDFKSPSKRPW